jgi:surface antigen
MLQIRTCLRAFAASLALSAALVSTISSASAATVTQTNVNSDQTQLDQARAELANVEGRLEHAQSNLDAANRQLDSDAAAEARVKHELSGIARYQYTQPPVLMQIIRARSIAEAMAQINQARIVGERRQRLLQSQQTLQVRDASARDSRAKDVQLLADERTHADAVVASAQSVLAQAQQDVARQQAAAAVAAQAAALAEASKLSMATTMAATTVGPVASINLGNIGNHFAYGYCTWYVANRRPIPWFGNAIDWWPNAATYGFSEGQTPQVGAVMVSSEAPIGHVSYVESVNPDGSWTVSEMNYSGWNVVDQRTVTRGQVPLVGFIYAHK